MIVECDACHKEATHSFNLRRSNTNNVRHVCCQKHYNIALSKLMVFLKHVNKKLAKQVVV
jgi:predicted amidophosphoribosyltransferase